MVLHLGIDAEYVLDKMQIYEINALMKFSYYKNKDSWEQARLGAYITAQCNSKKKLKLEDIIKFEWEKEKKDKENTRITTEEIAMLRKEAEEMERLFAMERETNNNE